LTVEISLGLFLFQVQVQIIFIEKPQLRITTVEQKLKE